MEKIALLGAGGKMGRRLALNLKGGPWQVDHVEVNPDARARVEKDLGITCVPADNALAAADGILMAVPDALIGKIAKGFIERVKPGCAIVMLDAAAPHAGELPKRDDVTYFISHPCHPSIFKHEPTAERHADFFGGIAPQAIVCALMQGPEEHYAQCEAVAKAIYAPVTVSHRVTVEQMAILEPGLSETIGATLVTALRQATDAAVAKGVPKGAAWDFMLGHLGIELALLFEQYPGQFSDGAKLAIAKAMPRLFRDDWLSVLEPDAITESVKDICNPAR
ncbi:phosphogluconate dehydrogenase C-terminal domain-containing protein [uncultured Alsobacter sp.]|uniref:phosphogluconate dehydrogenase C-terminal domain-containing protein n=1 Tax=uncultured Alsobacter sp. TaxID=1748258 RepID=UPI0025F3DDC5|nr:phosphogluconate dehydrogenase C-terminal domain-containing protein [uncultured Alsobacter sp.]